jgi:hypothetical protein
MKIFAWMLAIGLPPPPPLPFFLLSDSDPPCSDSRELYEWRDQQRTGSWNQIEWIGNSLLLLLPPPLTLLFRQLKLVDCRKNKSKMETLLHFIAKLIHGEGEASLATIETFYTEWVSVWDAKNVTLPSPSSPNPPPPRSPPSNWSQSLKI